MKLDIHFNFEIYTFAIEIGIRPTALTDSKQILKMKFSNEFDEISGMAGVMLRVLLLL